MPSQDRRRFNDLDHTKQARPQPGHPHQQRAIAATQRQARRSLPQRDIELMTEAEDLASSRHRDLNRSAINNASNRRSASIECDDALILGHCANPVG